MQNPTQTEHETSIKKRVLMWLLVRDSIYWGYWTIMREISNSKLSFSPFQGVGGSIFLIIMPHTKTSQLYDIVEWVQYEHFFMKTSLNLYT